MRRGLFWVLLLWVVLFWGCATVPPVTAPPAFSGGIETFAPSWTAYYPGIDYCAGKIETPRLELFAIRVNLADPGLRLVVSGEGAGEGQVFGHIPGSRVSSFARRYRCLAAINANPFDRVSAREGEDRAIVGLAVAGGVVLAPPHPGFDALVFDAGRRGALVNQQEAMEKMEETEKIIWAVGGFYRVLEGGRVPDAVRERGAARHPRSAGGLSADGRTLYLLAVDGRRRGSAGATEEELGRLLLRLGAVDGLNFDGGGSTALVLRDAAGDWRPVNVPIHNRVPHWERSVAVSLGIAPAF